MRGATPWPPAINDSPATVTSFSDFFQLPILILHTKMKRVALWSDVSLFPLLDDATPQPPLPSIHPPIQGKNSLRRQCC